MVKLKLGISAIINVEGNYMARPSAKVGIALILIAVQPPPALAIGGAESMDRPSAYPPSLPPYAPTQKPEGFTLPTVPATPSTPSLTTRKFTVKRVEITGNTVFEAEQLNAIAHSYEGREATLAELEELRQTLTRYYIDHGYVNSGAVIPADGFKDGVLHIAIIEGKYEVSVKGEERLRKGYIENRLQGDPDRPLNLQELQDRFQLLLSDPLISRMNGNIVPGSSPGHGILDVEVVRARAYHLSVFGNNYRPPSVGAEAVGFDGSLNNLTGLGDTLNFMYYHSSGSDRYAGGFTLPLSDWGTTGFFHFDEGYSAVVEAPTNKLDIKSQVHSLEGGISHPLINTLRQRLSLGVMLAVRENETSLGGKPYSFVIGEPTGHNQATVVRVFQDFTQRWDAHALAFRSTFSAGIHALGSTAHTKSGYPSSEYFAWLGQAQYAYRVGNDGSQVLLRGNVQLSNAALLPLEKIAVGGVGTVRGYRENYRVRDEGYNFSLEYRYPLWAGEAAKGDNRMNSLILIPFLDYGKAWDYPGAFTSGENNNALFSVGMGFLWQFKPLSTEFFYGYAINKPKPNQTGNLQDDGIHFQARLDVF
jgi:hemolysin activation/secretion protein